MKCFIANTDPARLPGTHWVAFVSYANRPSVVEFFDSYGYPISYYKELAAGCQQAGYFDDAYTDCVGERSYATARAVGSVWSLLLTFPISLRSRSYER